MTNKFRIYDKVNKSYIDPNWQEGWVTTIKGQMIIPQGQMVSSEQFDMELNTGIRDTNEIDIYEGDILDKGAVVRIGDDWCIDISEDQLERLPHRNNEYTIVGNIHDKE